MKKRFIFFGVFTIIVTLGMFTGCPQKLGNKDIPKPIPKPKIAEELNEEKEQEILPEQYRIGFKVNKNSTKIAFSEDKKKIIIPGYQELERIFKYSDDEITILNSDSGDSFFIRMDKVLNTKNKQAPWQAYLSNGYKSNVLYILYLADFVGLYQKKVPSMVDLTNAPDWFKELTAYRALTSSYAKTDEDLEIGSLNPKAEPGNEQVAISWNKISIVKKVVISWWIGEEKKTETITDDRTSFVITGLENYIERYFYITFLGANDKELKKETISATPRTGNNSLDFAQGFDDFVNEKANLLLKPEHGIYINTDSASTKFYFKKTNRLYIVVPNYQGNENVFNYTEEEKEAFKSNNTWNWLWNRMYKLINLEGRDPWENFNVNNRGSNVRWLLHIADLLNLYQAKLPDMIDLTNAPAWFKTLMETRKTGENFAKTDAEIEFDNSKVNIEAGNNQALIKWSQYPFVKKVLIKQWNKGTKKWEEIAAVSDGSSEFMINGLDNLKVYRFRITFFNIKGVKIKNVNSLSVTPGSQDQANYAATTSDFVNEKADLLLKKEYKMDPWFKKNNLKFLFKAAGNDISDGNNLEFPSYTEAENIFNFTEEEKKLGFGLLDARIEKVLNCGQFVPSDCAELNDWGGNVRWLLYLADFLNVYQAKLPDMVDLSNAPAWFKTLMAQRKNLPDSYVKDEYK